MAIWIVSTANAEGLDSTMEIEAERVLSDGNLLCFYGRDNEVVAYVTLARLISARQEGNLGGGTAVAA